MLFYYSVCNSCLFILIITISNYRLTERHRLIAEGRLPPISYEWEKELWAKRERFGTYGLASGVNPDELWPTVEVRITFCLSLIYFFPIFFFKLKSARLLCGWLYIHCLMQ